MITLFHTHTHTKLLDQNERKPLFEFIHFHYQQIKHEIHCRPLCIRYLFGQWISIYYVNSFDFDNIFKIDINTSVRFMECLFSFCFTINPIFLYRKIVKKSISFQIQIFSISIPNTHFQSLRMVLPLVCKKHGKNTHSWTRNNQSIALSKLKSFEKKKKNKSPKQQLGRFNFRTMKNNAVKTKKRWQELDKDLCHGYHTCMSSHVAF